MLGNAALTSMCPSRSMTICFSSAASSVHRTFECHSCQCRLASPHSLLKQGSGHIIPFRFWQRGRRITLIASGRCYDRCRPRQTNGLSICCFLCVSTSKSFRLAFWKPCAAVLVFLICPCALDWSMSVCLPCRVCRRPGGSVGGACPQPTKTLRGLRQK